MKSILTFLLIVAYSVSFAQNKKDSQGRKQGEWKKAYKDVQVYQYIGQFKNDKPYGEFTYFYKSGNVIGYALFYIWRSWWPATSLATTSTSTTTVYYCG